jgi:hypothetical protein
MLTLSLIDSTSGAARTIVTQAVVPVGRSGDESSPAATGSAQSRRITATSPVSRSMNFQTTAAASPQGCGR